MSAGTLESGDVNMANVIAFTKDQLHNIYEQVTKPESGTRQEEVSTSSDPAIHKQETIASTAASIGGPIATTDRVPPVLAPSAAAVDSPKETTSAPGVKEQAQATTGSALGSQTETSPSPAPHSHDKATEKAKSAHDNNMAAAAATTTTTTTALPPMTHNDSRRDSDVGPRNETSPEHHRHPHPDHHHHPTAATTTTTSSSSNDTNPSKPGPSHTENTTPTTNRRKSLAESPFRGRIDSTVTPRSASKKWSLSMGDFGLKVPRQPSNASSSGSKHLGRNGSDSGSGSVSMQQGGGVQGGGGEEVIEGGGGGGGPRVPRGIGSITQSVQRGSVDAMVSERDPAKRWSFGHGDFGLKMPRQGSNVPEVGAVAAGGGATNGVGGTGAGAGGSGGAGTETEATTLYARRVSLGRQGARGIGSISEKVRRGSVDASASEHDKARKWSLRDGDFGLKWPGKGKGEGLRQE